MITIDALKEYGADTEEALARCMGMEDFYLNLVSMQLEDQNFEKLEEAIAEGDPKKTFEAAHALKGVLGNLSLDPLLEPVQTITERCRNAEHMPDLSDQLPAFKAALAGFRALAK